MSSWGNGMLHNSSGFCSCTFDLLAACVESVTPLFQVFSSVCCPISDLASRMWLSVLPCLLCPSTLPQRPLLHTLQWHNRHPYRSVRASSSHLPTSFYMFGSTSFSWALVEHWSIKKEIQNSKFTSLGVLILELCLQFRISI